MDIQTLISGVPLVVVIGAVVWSIGRAGLDSKWLPLASLVCGIVISCLFSWGVSADAILGGLVAGLVSSGAYDNIAKGVVMVKGE